MKFEKQNLKIISYKINNQKNDYQIWNIKKPHVVKLKNICNLIDYL